MTQCYENDLRPCSLMALSPGDYALVRFIYDEAAWRVVLVITDDTGIFYPIVMMEPHDELGEYQDNPHDTPYYKLPGTSDRNEHLWKVTPDSPLHELCVAAEAYWAFVGDLMRIDMKGWINEVG